MRNTSARKVLRDIIGTIMILIPAFIIGHFLKGYGQICNILLSVSSVLLLVSVIFGFISFAVFSPRREARKKLTVDRDTREIWKYTERCDANIEKEIGKIRLIIVFEKIYFFFNCVCLILGFASALALGNASAYVLFALASFWLMCFENIGVSDIDEPGLALDSETYPAMEKLVKETVGAYLPEAVYGKDIFAFAVHGPEVSTARWRNGYAICIGVTAVGLLSREQLKMAILHELCHIKNGDADFSADVMGLYARYSSPKLFFTMGMLLMGIPMFVIRNRIPKFMTASSRAHELRVDREVAKLINYEEKRAYIGAAATMKMLDYYLSDNRNGENIYEAPEPPYDFETRTEQGFLKSLEEKEDFWRELIEKELEAKKAPYPTFARRREALGVKVDDYEVAPGDDDYMYVADRDSLRHKSDNIIHDGMELTFEDDRKSNYLEPMNSYKKYCARIENGETLDLGERVDHAFALECIGRYDEAMAAYDGILKEYPTNATALFRRGLMYLNDLDENGIDMVLRAMEENTNYIKNGVQVLSDFCIKLGLEDRLEECRQRSVELLEYMYNSYSHVISIEKNDKYLPVGLPDPVKKEIVDLVISEFGEDLDTAFMVDKKHEGITATLIFVRPCENYDVDRWNSAYHNVFLNLDVREEHFMLDAYLGEPSYIYKVAKVDGAMIYKKR